MNPKLRMLINGILDNEDNTGCNGDLTVTSKRLCDKLRIYMDDYDTPTVVVSCDGGVVSIDDFPEGVKVIVKDRDLESYDEDDERIKEDDKGNYMERVWE